MRGYDLWATERAKASVAEHGLRFLTEDAPAILKVWHPKATKPAVHYRFRTPELRDAYLVDYVERFGQSQARKANAREQRRAAVAEHSDKIGVGHIFRYSWGYDQTNIEYYQVIAKTGQTVTVREIAQSVVPGSEGFMSESVKPRVGHFLENAKPLTKRLQFTEQGEAYLSFEFGWCGLWRGEANYQSHYA